MAALDKKLAMNTNTSAGGCEVLEHISDFCAINSTHTCSQVWEDMNSGCHAIIALILFVLVVLVVAVIVLVVSICCCCHKKYRRRKYSIIEGQSSTETELEDLSIEIKQKKGQQEMKKERDTALSIASTLWEDEYTLKMQLPELGCRLGKFWHQMEKKGLTGQKYLQTIAHCKKCPLPLHDQKTMDKLLTYLQHPYLHIITGVRYASGQVSILQPFMEQGSLRDEMFKTKPTKDWVKKYTQSPFEPFPPEEMSRCGRNVLKAVLFLYEVGFPPLGHIQSGNIFHTDRRYVLGGYENTLLGYRTRLYKDLEKDGLLNMIDVIMFGHVMYEMASGCLFSIEKRHDVFLDTEDYEMVKDEEIKKMLTFIFSKKWEGSHKKMIRKVLEHRFFAGQLSQDEEEEIRDAKEGVQEAKEFLQKVIKWKAESWWNKLKSKVRHEPAPPPKRERPLETRV